jgi:hypothetical protein
MSAKGYCTVDDIAAFLGRTFTAAQLAQCDALIESAEIFIDEETNRGWLVGAQTDEAHYISSQNVWLRYAPVATVATVTGRSGLGETEETLTVDDDYEVQDLNGGLIVLTSPGNYDRVLISYTPVDTLPADLKQACIEIVSAWLQPSLAPGMYGLDSYSLPDLSVKFSRSHVQQPAPPMAQRVLDRYRYPVTA